MSNIFFVNGESHRVLLMEMVHDRCSTLLILFYLFCSSIKAVIVTSENRNECGRFGAVKSFTPFLWKSKVRDITVFSTDFVCLYTYELSLWKIVRSSVILLLPLFEIWIFRSGQPDCDDDRIIFVAMNLTLEQRALV